MEKNLEQRKADATQAAHTITEQLGGYMRLRAMIGLHDLTAGYDPLHDVYYTDFKFRGSRKANVARVVLNRRDTYDVKFYKLNGRTFDLKKVTEAGDIYADDLARLFEDVTGLRLSL